MITVVCFEWDNYLGRGAEYVRRFSRMVRANISEQPRIVCFSDRALEVPGVEAMRLSGRFKSWWRKLEAFRPGLFEGRVMLSDIDTVVTGSLDELMRQKGAVDLRTWGWERAVFAGGHLLWDAGEHERLWHEYDDSIPERFENDQEWMSTLGIWDALPAHLIRSYRYHCREAVPDGCAMVAFHGRPKPHEVRGGWVERAWRV